MTVEVYLAVIIVLLFSLLVLPSVSSKSHLWRSCVGFVVVIFVLRYLAWRLFVTVLPASFDKWEGVWVLFCFVLEVIAWAESGIFFLLLTKTTDRLNEADRYEKALRLLAPTEFPMVDVYIPTYNEGLDVLERTILGAMNIEWPRDKLNVWILDDGKRSWLKDYCDTKAIGYITRPTNEGAKAGNINHALQVTQGDFVAIFDADFVAHKNFLYRTIGFFSNPKVAIVQTPQTFFNKDFVQTNLAIQSHIPDEQRLFFDVIMPSRDAWNVAFFCGSCGVLRRKVIIEGGALSFDSITEDILLSVKLLGRGYITRYLSEQLSHGLAAETLDAFTIQRQRWCRGGIQLLFAKEGILNSGLSFIQKLFFLPFHWIIHAPIRVTVLIVPIIFLWTGVAPMVLGDPYDIIRYQLPVFFLAYTVMMWYAPWRWIPMFTTAFENIVAFNLIPTIFKSLVNPYGVGFKVTPKGRANKLRRYHAWSLGITLVLFIMTLLGILINFHPKYRIVAYVSFFPIAVAWCIINLLVLGLMLLMCYEQPRHRREERFPSQIPAYAHIDATIIPGWVTNISVTGLKIYLGERPQALEIGQIIEFKIENFDILYGKVINYQGKEVSCEFVNLPASVREQLIVFIYTGNFVNDQATHSIKNFLKSLWKRAFGSNKI